MEQTRVLQEGIGVKPMTAVVGLGFRGVDKDVAPVKMIHRGKSKTLTQKQRRRQAIEPAIGHVKLDHRMDRCWLAGQQGDALHAVLCAAGYNIRWLLRAIVRLGLKAAFLWLAQMVAMAVRSMVGTYQRTLAAMKAAQMPWVVSGHVTALAH